MPFDSESRTEMISFYFVYLILGVTGLFSNIVVILAIVRIKNFRKNRWLILSVALMCADCTLSVGFTIPAALTIDQLIRIDAKSFPNAKYSSLGCVFVNAPLILGSISDQLLTTFIAFDRIVAMAFPIWYRVKADEIVKSMLMLCISATTAFLLGSFINVESDNFLSLCTMTSGQNPNFKYAYYMTANSLCILIVILYLILLAIVICQRRKLKILDHQDFYLSGKATQIYKQLKITHVISGIILFYCLTSVPGYTMLDTFRIVWPEFANYPRVSIRISMFSQLLISLNTFVNCFIYAVRDKQIQLSIKSLAKSITTQIWPRHSVSPANNIQLGIVNC